MKQRKLLSFFLCVAMLIGLFSPIQAKAAEIETQAEEDWNLAEGQTAAASSTANGCGPEIAVDGVNNTSNQWNSENMKSGTSEDPNSLTQTPQWLTVDLGADGSVISEIKLYYNMKVWPMVYEIQTSNDENFATYTTVVSVSRNPYNGGVKNGTEEDGKVQNIADETNNTTPATAANCDTITLTSVPALKVSNLNRYVRLYISKVNSLAPGNNVNLREIEIYGINPERHVPVDLTGSLTNVTKDSLEIVENQYRVKEDAFSINHAKLVIRGSEYENVITNEGNISQYNIGERDVTLLLRASAMADIYNYVEKNVTVTVEDHSENYPESWFPTVENPNEKPGVIPTIQEWYGYEGSMVLSEESKIIINDAAGVDLRKAAEITKANILEISGLDLEIETGNTPEAGQHIYIESLIEPSAYDLGEEGYLMVTNDHGVQIYAPTYTGCVFGTVTLEQMLWMAEDHMSIPQGIMRDYPAYEVRGIKLDIARTPYRYQQLEDYAKIMRWYKMSEYDLHINDNDNCNINGATYETHSGFHRLESEEFPSLKNYNGTKHAGIPSDVVNEEYYNKNQDYKGNPVYTKQQWRDLAEKSSDYGFYLLTEIDLPGHSLVYNQYADDNPDNIEWLAGGTKYTSGNVGTAGGLELLDLVGSNAARAKQLATTLWDEYTRGEEPVIYGDIVHIGADEYWDHNTAGINDAFALFADDIRKVVQTNLGEDTKIRMWGASTVGFQTATSVLEKTHQQLAEDYQLDIWYTGYENPALRTTEGYEIVNSRDCFMYGNPGRIRRDVPNAEHLFYSWNPTMFGGNNPSLGEPNLIGAKAVIWGDQSQEGMTEKDIHQRVLRAITIVSEKTWNGTDADDTFTEFEIRAAHLAEGPGTEIAMEIDSESSLIMNYDFTNVSLDGTKVYDTSGNGYDGTLQGGKVAEGWLSFDGNTLLTTPLKTLSYPYTVTFDLQLSQEDGEANTKESSLFSGYDGRIQVVGKNGNLSADVNYFTRNFGYTVPTDGTTVNITLVGTYQATRLYVNGELVKFLYQENVSNDGVSAGNVQTISASVPLPLEKIGEELNGKMANLKVYNKAMTAEELLTDDGMVNVAQNAYAGGESYKNGDAYDDGVQRTSIAMKAIDGDGFVTAAAATAPNTATSEQTSYWQGDHADSALTVDLGQLRKVSGVSIQWRGDGRGSSFNILTSQDGKEWTTTKEIVGNTDYFQNITFEVPVEARFVKMQGVTVSGSYKIQEFMVYETVDKKALEAALTPALELVRDREYTFENISKEKEEAFQTVVLANAIMESPLATQTEVDVAKDALADAISELQKEEVIEPEKPVMYTVSFNDTDGKEICKSQSVSANGLAKEPTPAPSKEGFKFKYWSLNERDAYEFSTPVTGNIVLKAVWEEIIIPPTDEEVKPVMYTVSFNDTDGSTLYESRTVSAGSLLGKVDMPEKAEYAFLGWYDEAGKLFEFEKNEITKSMTVTAKWLYIGEVKKEDIEEVLDKLGKTEDGCKVEIEDKIWVAGVQDLVYTGKKQTFAVRVYDGTKLLTEKTDYTVTFKNNQNAYTLERNGDKTTVEGKEVKVYGQKAPQVMIKMKGDYTGTRTLNFQILPLDISVSANDILLDNGIVGDNLYMDKKNTDKEQAVKPVIIWNGKKLSLGKDFVVNPAKVQINETGEKILTVMGTEAGNFTGSRTLKLVIGDKAKDVAMSKVKVILPLKKVAWEKLEEQSGSFTFAKDSLKVENGKKHTLKEGVDYKVVGYLANDRAGTATVILEGMGNKEGDYSYHGQKRITFKIEPKAVFNKVKLDDLKTYKDEYVYTGKEVTPLSWKDAEGKQLIRPTLNGIGLEEGTYEVSYSKNTQKGKATVTITGNPKKGYTGSKKFTFSILAADIQSVSVNFADGTEKATAEFSKGGVKPEVAVKDADGNFLMEGKDYTLSYGNNKKADVTGFVVVKGKANYTGKKTLEFAIEKKSISSNDITVEVKDKVINTNTTKKWKQSFKVYDADGKALNAKRDYVGKEAEYYQVLKGVESKLNGDEDLTVGTTILVKVKAVKDGAYAKDPEAVAVGSYRIIAKDNDINKAVITVKPQYYTRKPVILTKEDITAGFKNSDKILTYGEVEKEGVDFVAIKYEKNVNKGKAKVTFKGCGIYGGTKTVTFKIEQKNIGEVENTGWWKELMDKLFN